MSQTKISNWFNILNTVKERPPIYFYLEWVNSNRPQQIKWCLNKPDDCNIIKKIYFKKNKSLPIIICGKLINKCKIKDPYYDLQCLTKTASYYEFSNTSLLKSQIQKCIRRNEHCKAIRSSFHLMRLDFIELCFKNMKCKNLSY